MSANPYIMSNARLDISCGMRCEEPSASGLMPESDYLSCHDLGTILSSAIWKRTVHLTFLFDALQEHR